VFESVDPREPELGPGAALSGAALLLLGAVLAAALLLVPDAPAATAAAAAAGLRESAITSPVNAVLLEFRALDTLLEKAVLLVAVAGLWALLPAAPPHARPANFTTAHAVEPPLVLLLKILAPLLVLTAIHLLWLGAEASGGAFQAGTVLAAIGILMALARMLTLPGWSAGPARVALTVGFLLFWGLGLAMLAVTGGFLDWPAVGGKALVITVEIGLVVSVAAALFLLACGLPDPAA
jgi:multisubunit Na+/H+ antiporter MnhB subunit